MRPGKTAASSAGSKIASEGGAFNYPSSRGPHRKAAAFMPTEPRFQGNHGSKPADAIYSLPSTLSCQESGFGMSTRADWDTKPKKSNPCAGPGSYRPAYAVGKQTLSDVRSLPSLSFAQAPRNPGADDTTPSPGPTYKVQTYVGDCSSKYSFGTSTRPSLYATGDSPGPNINLKSDIRVLNEKVNTTFGVSKRMKGKRSKGAAPGPIYDLDLTGFKTGPSGFRFSETKRF